MFGEILPQAICTRYGLTVGATVAPFVQLLLWAFFPIAYPISKVLDWMLGKGHAALLRRAELKTFVDFHGNEAGKGGDLTHYETTIIAGALEMTEKTAKDARTPILKAFSIDLDGTLNLSRLATSSVSLPSLEGMEDRKDVIPILCSIFLANQGAGEATGEGKCLSWLRTLRGGHGSRVGALDRNNHIWTTGGMDGQINDVRVRAHI